LFRNWPSRVRNRGVVARPLARSLARSHFYAPQHRRARLSVALQIPVRLYPPAVIMARGVPRKSSRGSRGGNLALPSWESIFPPVALSFRLPSIRTLHTRNCNNLLLFLLLSLFFPDHRKRNTCYMYIYLLYYIPSDLKIIFFIFLILFYNTIFYIFLYYYFF